MQMKTEEQSSMEHRWNTYVVPTVKVMEFRSNNIIAASSLEDYDENVIS